jgi:hypothetical protein
LDTALGKEHLIKVFLILYISVSNESCSRIADTDVEETEISHGG